MPRGFTLFEILLTMIIMSMIIMGGVQWQHRKHEEAAAQQLGLRLFQYGMAVSEYARQNPDKYSSKNPPQPQVGLNWLKTKLNPETCKNPDDQTTCETFLGNDFNFNVGYLIVDATEHGKDDAQIWVTFSPPETTGPMEVDLIQVGKIYHKVKGKEEKLVDLSLDSRAINFANQYSDQSGTAEITYKLSEPLDQSSMISGRPSTYKANIDNGYLRTDGQNEMNASVRFDANAVKRNIEGVEEIQFTTTPAGTDSRKINQVDQIQFANSRNFRGIVKTEHQVTSVNKPDALNWPLIPYTNDTVCFITWDEIIWHTNPSTPHDMTCKLTINTNNRVPTWYLRADKQTGHYDVNCAAACLNWGP